VQHYRIIDEMKEMMRKNRALYSKKSKNNGIKRDNIFRQIPFFNIFKELINHSILNYNRDFSA